MEPSKLTGKYHSLSDEKLIEELESISQKLFPDKFKETEHMTMNKHLQKLFIDKETNDYEKNIGKLQLQVTQINHELAYRHIIVDENEESKKSKRF